MAVKQVPIAFTGSQASFECSGRRFSEKGSLYIMSPKHVVLVTDKVMFPRVFLSKVVFFRITESPLRGRRSLTEVQCDQGEPETDQRRQAQVVVRLQASTVLFVSFGLFGGNVPAPLEETTWELLRLFPCR